MNKIFYDIICFSDSKSVILKKFKRNIRGTLEDFNIITKDLREILLKENNNILSKSKEKQSSDNVREKMFTMISANSNKEYIVKKTQRN